MLRTQQTPVDEEIPPGSVHGADGGKTGGGPLSGCEQPGQSSDTHAIQTGKL